MKRRLFSVFAILVLVIGMVPASVFAAPHADDDGGLQAGQAVTFEQKVPVNIVFIGYKQNTINKQAMLDQLPGTYTPIVRYPPFYGLPGRDLGLKFNFDYKVTFTENSFANRFFNYLKQIGQPRDPTVYQLAYNDQVNNVLDVTGPVLYIDAPSVEDWLAKNLKVDHKKGYTVVFINWYGRNDFKFHLYEKTDAPDPDTGYNFGLDEFSKMIAWGGTNSRLWFYDLSAGPEWNTTNWLVDFTDLDGNGFEDYRMPPIWEYTAGGYRDPSALSTDLGLVTRFAGINLLFTTSPLYDPLVTAPDVRGRKVVHINMFEDDPGSLGTDWINKNLIQHELSSFEPYYKWHTNLVDRNPIDNRARRAFRIFAGLLVRDDCWNAFGDTFAELFCFFDNNRNRYLPDYREPDYVTGVHAFNTTAANLGSQFGLLGYADDNWVNGTQSYVFEFGSAEYRSFGYGFSSTTVHEVGHHLGMSHPHDGYDSEYGIDYGPGDEFYYAWIGDESDTVMHYLGLTNGFGRFDQDNMYRYEFAGYLNWANSLLDDILAHPRANRVRNNVARAQNYAEKAIRSFNQWNYLDAATNARLAYDEIAKAADTLNIETPTEELDLLAPFMIAPHEGDWIRPK
jgi:hypothetical protein